MLHFLSTIKTKFSLYKTGGLFALSSHLFLSACLLQASVGMAYQAPDDGVFEKSIDWGVMMDLSGTASASQIPWVNGFQSYIRKVNEAGGIHGRKINVRVEDDRYDVSIARSNYERLSSQTPVLGFSGLGNSSAQASMMPMIKRGKIPLVGAYAITKLGLEPANPMYYAGYCGTKEMAQVGVGYFSDSLKLKAPKIAVAHMDVAGGKEYAEYIEAEVSKRGGIAKAFPIKIGAADVTAQVLDIMAMKPDVVTVYGVPSPTILLMRTMLQYNVRIPTFSITHLGTSEIYNAIGPEAGSIYNFVSCFTPGDIQDSEGVKELATFADKYGHSGIKSNVNFIGGWVVGHMVAEAISRTGPEPTREKLVAMMNKGFVLDTQGVSATIRYTQGDHRGLVSLRPYSYDYINKKFKAVGKYSDYEKYVK